MNTPFSLRRYRAAVVARTLEFVRDRASLSWNLLVPFAMVLGFSVIFSGPPQPLFKVAVLGPAPIEAAVHPFFAQAHVQFYREPGEAAAVRKVERHRVDLLLDPGTRPARYWINPDSQKGQLAESLLRAADPAAQRVPVTGVAIRYVDWVLPGVLGMNLMFSCLWGLGYVIVRYRKSGYLKRLNATPLTALEFIAAQMTSRLALVMLTSSLMFAACALLLGVRVEGSVLDLFLVTLLGAISMTAMGLLVAARITSEELSGGLLNLLSMPMMVLSGVFFSLDGAPEWVQLTADLFPLTHLLDAVRAILLDGAGLSDLGRPLGILALIAGICILIGTLSFKWRAD
ncbi:MAG TPA: ABC transporter permease [Nevskiaceae bacterium]|nr:ABC transporter permease [Nevskiaceae bacterium]